MLKTHGALTLRTKVSYGTFSTDSSQRAQIRKTGLSAGVLPASQYWGVTSIHLDLSSPSSSATVSSSLFFNVHFHLHLHLRFYLKHFFIFIFIFIFTITFSSAVSS